MTTKVAEPNIRETDINPPRVRGLKPFNRWCGENGITRATGWRWRRDGIIKTINIYGRQYVSHEEEERFQQRASRGEFRRDFQVPNPARERGVLA